MLSRFADCASRCSPNICPLGYLLDTTGCPAASCVCNRSPDPCRVRVALCPRVFCEIWICFVGFISFFPDSDKGVRNTILSEFLALLLCPKRRSRIESGVHQKYHFFCWCLCRDHRLHKHVPRDRRAELWMWLVSPMWSDHSWWHASRKPLGLQVSKSNCSTDRSTDLPLWLLGLEKFFCAFWNLFWAVSIFSVQFDSFMPSRAHLQIRVRCWWQRMPNLHL